MEIDGPLIVAIIAAGLGGGGATELIRAIVGRRTADNQDRRADLTFFYETWQREAKRMQGEIDALRRIVTGLSAEVQRLGGDPLPIRLSAAKRPPTPKPPKGTKP